MRELDVLLKRMDVRKHNETAVQASFHGIKIPLRGLGTSEEAVAEMSDKEIASMNKAMEESRQRLARERAGARG